MATIVPRIYSNFRGVDFRGEEINLVRSPDSLNVWKDYKETESIRTRPGMRLHRAFSAKVNSIFFLNGEMLVHCGSELYAIQGEEFVKMGAGLANRSSQGFVYANKLYILDGQHYLCYDGVNLTQVEGYVPTTSIGRKPSGGGTIYEDVNMLSDYRINTFLGDGESTDFHLDAQNIDPDYRPVVTVNDEAVTSFSVDWTKGVVKFTKAPGKPATDGQDNVSIRYKRHTGYEDRIFGCTMVQPFDNRVFFSGNPDYPNVVWHCSLDNPGYCSDLDYYKEGLDEAAIKGLVAGNNVLWVFREPSDANTTVFYHQPTLDADYGKIYPSQHSSVTTGCIGKAVNFNDDIVFFSERGMEGISGDITTEQVVAHRSSMVDRKLIAEKDYKNMILAEWDGYLFVFVGNKAYLADSRAMFTNENHNEYEWFYWQMEKKITCAKVHDGVLYLGTEDGVYTLADNDCNLESYWVTPKDKLNNPHKLKTTNKRGCVAEATGDISVYAKLEDTDFELIGSYENVTDYFVSRIKRKKFKDIQLKFHSNTRFSLETVTLECFIGGYIKR